MPHRAEGPGSGLVAGELDWVAKALALARVRDDLDLVASAAPARCPGVRHAGLHLAGAAGGSPASEAPAVETIAGPAAGERLAAATLQLGRETRALLPDPAWPELAGEGAEGAWALPLRAGLRPVAVLVLYSSGRQPWQGPAAGGARRLVCQAEAMVTDAAERIRLEQLSTNLWTAVESRTAIGQAQGVLMVREGITAQAAFERLTELSQRSHQKVRDVAARIVAEVPGAG